jgi:hypothetical protein
LQQRDLAMTLDAGERLDDDAIQSFRVFCGFE